MTKQSKPQTVSVSGLPFLVKTFSEITTQELKAIYQLRQQVFIIEQNCPYPDIDDDDLDACHVFLSQTQSIDAYARILTDADGDFHIGRVVVCAGQRHRGLGYALMTAAIKICRDRASHRDIIISAQSYLRDFYQSLGFQATQDYYLEDNIPHMRMVLPPV